jgi:hypothetical protein
MINTPCPFFRVGRHMISLSLSGNWQIFRRLLTIFVIAIWKPLKIPTSALRDRVKTLIYLVQTTLLTPAQALILMFLEASIFYHP